MITEIEVRLTSVNDKQSRGKVKIQHWEPKERTKRATKFFFMCWGLAIAFVPIPIAHFICVPGFFLAGPIGAWLMMNQASQVLGGEGVCPECAAVLPLEKGRDVWPLSDLCTKCRKTVTVEKA